MAKTKLQVYSGRFNREPSLPDVTVVPLLNLA